MWISESAYQNQSPHPLYGECQYGSLNHHDGGVENHAGNQGPLKGQPRLLKNSFPNQK